jgi:hypothetical protein
MNERIFNFTCTSEVTAKFDMCDFAIFVESFLGEDIVNRAIRNKWYANEYYRFVEIYMEPFLKYENYMPLGATLTQEALIEFGEAFQEHIENTINDILVD